MNHASENQVTPFSIKTEDGESIHVWHVVPLPVYSKYEAKLLDQPSGFREDITAAESFRILRDDPEAKVLLYCKKTVSVTRGAADC